MRPALLMIGAALWLGAALNGPTAAAAAEGAAMMAEPLDAVGRFNHAGYRRTRHCTMFAASARVALTASHCMRGTPARQTHLLFGAHKMTWTAHIVPEAAHEAAFEVTALCLSKDAPDNLALASVAPALGDPVTIINYQRPRVHAQTATPCTVTHADAGGLILDCQVDEGGSGAPVVDASGEVVALVSARTPNGMLAVPIPESALGLCTGG